MPAKILIVDDHALVREALRTWLMIAFPDCLFQEANSGEDAITLAFSNPPDLILMDFELPGISGIEATRQIKERIPQARVVMLSIHEDIQYVVEAIRGGVSCYISKRKMHTDLIPAVADLLFTPMGS